MAAMPTAEAFIFQSRRMAVGDGSSCTVGKAARGKLAEGSNPLRGEFAGAGE